MGIEDVGLILAYSAGIMIVFMISWIFVTPLKFLGRLILNSILGAVFLILFNLVAQYFNFYIGVNLETAMMLGILGIPGFIAILLLKLLI